MRTRFEPILALLTLGLLAGVAGCRSAPVSSKLAEPGDEGIPYSLPRTVLKVTAVFEKLAEGHDFRATLSVEPLTVADPTHALVLQHKRSAFRSDELKVAVAPSGLLRSISLESEDETVGVVRDLVRGAIAAVKAAGGMAVQSAGPRSAAADAVMMSLNNSLMAKVRPLIGTHEFLVPLPDLLPEAPVEVVSVVPDCKLYSDWRRVGTPFQDKDWILHLELLPASKDSAPKQVAYSAENGEGRTRALPFELGKGKSGILVRGAEPFVLRARLSLDWDTKITLGAGETLPVVAGLSQRSGNGTLHLARDVARAEVLASIPDYAPAFRLPLESVSFARAKYTVQLADGGLASVDADTPSSVAGIATLPFDVATALIALPTELIQLKFDVGKGQADLAEQASAARAKDVELEAEYQLARTQADAALANYSRAKSESADRAEVNAALAAHIGLAIEANKKAVLLGLTQPFPPSAFPAYER